MFVTTPPPHTHTHPMHQYNPPTHTHNLTDQTKDIICRPSLFLSISLPSSAYQSNTAQGKKAMPRSTCVRVYARVCLCVPVRVCVSGLGVGRSVCLSAKHRFILFSNLFLLLASTIHSDVPLGEELGVKMSPGFIVASKRRLKKLSDGPRDHWPPTQGRAGQQQTELTAVRSVPLFPSAVIGLVRQRER